MQKGDLVVYGIHGVCRIVDVENCRVDRKKVEYFVLVPQDQPNAKFYIPTQNPKAVAKIRRILTKEEVEALFQSADIKNHVWIEEENRRREEYRRLIASADCSAIIPMLQGLYLHKRQQLAAGRKFHMSDENFMKDAERLICSELACVLDIPKDKIGEYIRARLEK